MDKSSEFIDMFMRLRRVKTIISNRFKLMFMNVYNKSPNKIKNMNFFNNEKIIVRTLVEKLNKFVRSCVHEKGVK